jgi:hypothetical protein
LLLDPQRYPRAHAYIAQLPQGLESYPACRVKFDAVELLLGRCSELVEEKAGGALPAPIRDTLNGRPGSWHPDVAVMAITLMARDRSFSSDTEYMNFSYQSSSSLFDRIIYRALMKLMSPTLLVMGSARRWTTFRSGTQLRSVGSKKVGNRMTGEVILSHPPGLYPDLFLHSLCHTFRAALDLSRGRGVEVRLGLQQAEQTQYHLAWDD